VACFASAGWMTFRNLEERDCATVAERRRVLPLHPSPIFALVLLGYAVTIGSRNSKEEQSDLRNVNRNNTQSCVLRLSDSRVNRRDSYELQTVYVYV
jgi:hypothetical protein